MKIQIAFGGVLIAAALFQPSNGQQERPADNKAEANAQKQPAPDPQPAVAEPRPVASDSLPTSPKAPVDVPLPQSDTAQFLNQLNTIQNDLSTLRKQNWVKDLGPTTVALMALIITTIISVVSLNRNARLARETMQSKAYEEERKAIREKRDRFYGPFTQLRGISKNLHHIFNSRRGEEERSRFSNEEGKFRTLIALCRGHVFTGVDKVLLDEIVRIGDESASLITKEIGLVDNPKLQAELSRAAAHYRIIKLAAEGKLTTDGNEFEGFTFPHELDGKIDELDARLRTLEHIPHNKAAAGTAGQKT